MANDKSGNQSATKFSDLGTKEKSLVEQRLKALAEINRQRALAVDAHLELVRHGIIDFRAMADCW